MITVVTGDRQEDKKNARMYALDSVQFENCEKRRRDGKCCL